MKREDYEKQTDAHGKNIPAVFTGRSRLSDRGRLRQEKDALAGFLL